MSIAGRPPALRIDALERMLASHSQVEGTMELPDIMAAARRPSVGYDDTDGANYPALLATLRADQ